MFTTIPCKIVPLLGFLVLGQAPSPSRFLSAQESVARQDEPSDERTAFFAEDGNFTIAFPNKPTVKTEELKSANGDSFIQNQYVCEVGNGAILVTFQPSDEKLARSKETLEEAYSATRSRLLNATGGQLLEEKDVLVSGSVAAREFRFSIPSRSGEYLTRIFFANRKFFQIIAVGTPDFIKESDTREIINSFRFSNRNTLPSVGSKDFGLQTFSTSYGRFSALLPELPTYSRNPFPYEDGTHGVRHGYLSRVENGVFLISFLDMPVVRGLDSEGLDEFFGAMVGGMVQSTDSELRFVERQDPIDGRDFWRFRYFNSKTNVGSAGRFFAVSDRVYIIQSLGANDFLDAEKTVAIIDSFRPGYPSN